jgi:hypothetical protein
MKKLFIFSDTHWSLGRVYRDVAKHLGSEFETKFLDWGNYDSTSFIENYNWCDVCITNLVCLETLPVFYPHLNYRKCIFVSHGGIEHKEITPYNPNFHYGMTCESLRSRFPSYLHPYLMPNGVDPENFDYKPRDGTLNNLGWCGATHVPLKQFEWAKQISEKASLPLQIASTLTYDEVRNWYHGIDLLLVTTIPVPHMESGPLPPFEAIVSGIPVIGTPVGNFANIPGPKFTTVDDAVSFIEHFKTHPEELRELAVTQYNYVMNNFTYKTLIHYWRHAIENAL